jgi:phosphohistidine phosphatase
MEVHDLFIMRHAKSDWNNDLISDFDRPLNERGMRDAPRMALWLAKWMATNNITVDLLVSSPALRAKQTAEEVISQFNLPESSFIYDKRMYLAGIDTLQNIIRETDDKHRSLILIGHNPGLEKLALELSKDQLPIDTDGSLMTTANIVHLRLTQPWNNLERHKGEFVQMMRPRQLS